VLDLVGAAVLIAGVAVFVAAWTLAGALVTAGALLLAFSWLLDRRAL